MKVFESNANGWDSKHNFVDENNVVVGFDASQSCCESFGYHWTHNEPVKYKEPEPLNVSEEFLKPYRFDPAWFRQLENVSGEGQYSAPLEDGGAVAFKLTAEGQPDLFLILYNSHNGYYSHGFEMNVGGIVTHNGSL